MMEKIQLLHTNDLHSHLENWPKIRRYLLGKQNECQEKKQPIITIDLGDFVDRWHPLTEATDGKANIRLMNQVHYDAVTIGNNEGVGNSKEQLNTLYNEADFEVILGNLFDPVTGQLPKWATPYKIIETPQNNRLGLLGLTAPFPLTYGPNGWDIRSVDEVLPQLVQELKGQCDVLILLSHLGIDEDLKIASKYPEIDILLGSHTHHLFENGQKMNHTQLSAAGKFGYYIGEVEFSITRGKMVESSAKAIPTSQLPALPEDQIEIDGYLEEGHRLLKEKRVGKLPKEFSQDLHEENPLIFAALEAVKEYNGTEAAILNNGLFLKDLPVGIVTEDDLHEVLPHPMHLIQVTLKGADLIRLVEEMEKNRHFLRKFPIKGMGFRGKIFGEICYSGISYDKKSRLVCWQKELVDPKKIYTFTTVDHFMFIPFFPTIEIAGEIKFLFPKFIRTILGDYFRRHYPIQ